MAANMGTAAVWLHIILLWLVVIGLWLVIGYFQRRIEFLEESRRITNETLAEAVEAILLIQQTMSAMREYDRELYERLTLLTRQVAKERT